ncbi:MAG TPA: V-type ATP synthase subunit F [bacterium]|nr:V-type ATP synthase subunit F [bacterium]
MKFYCISDPESATAFRLLNIHTIEVSNHRQASEAFQTLAAGDDVGVILITDTATLFIQRDILSFTRKNTQPLVLEIPSWKGSASKLKKGKK